MFETCNIRSMTEDDLPTVLSWRNHFNVRRFMFSQHEIELTEHLHWFERASRDPTKRLLIVEISKKSQGFVQFDHVTSEGTATWGFYVSPDAPKGTGRNLGVTALSYAFKSFKLKKISAQVISNNNASINFHQRMGFTRVEESPVQKLIDGSFFGIYSFEMLASDWHPENFKFE